MPQIVTVDLETFYSREFSLTKLATEHYVRSPLFETIGIAIGLGNEQPVWYPQPEVKDALAKIDWSDKLVLAQNTAFDASILAWHYDVQPLAWLDTLGMSRALFPHEKSHSLKAQAERHGVGVKGEEVINALGLRYADFGSVQLAKYAEYCINDVTLTKKLFDIYMGMGFPKIELKLIDLTLRMFTEPTLILDKEVLQVHLKEVKERKANLLDNVRDMMLAEGDPDYVHAVFSEGTDGIKKLLMSNEKFAALLRTYGVEPPTKISETTKKEAYAFAKTDQAFRALEDHPDDRIQGLVAARLGNKTTIEETRTERFIGMADRGAFPVPLRYYGAHSGRWCLTGDHEVLTSGGWVRLDVWNGETIRQWDANTKRITWCVPAVSSFDIDEPVVAFNSKYHKAVYTKEHRLPIRKRHTVDAVKDITAGRMTEVAKKELYVSGYAELSGHPINPTQLRLIVAMHADGHNVQDRKNNMVRFRFAKARKVARITALLTDLRIPYTTAAYPSEPHVTSVVIRGADAPDWLRGAKTLPTEFYSLDAGGAQVVMDELPHWDGYAHTESHFEWCGKDQEAATIFATLAHLCGYRTITLLIRREDMGWADVWKVRFTKTTTVTEKGTNATWMPFVGKVYCPTVDTGYFLCRRQGTIFITGNSGQDSVNLQNLPSRGANAGRIKKAIMAPEGHVVIDCDSSQIECLSGDTQVLTKGRGYVKIVDICKRDLLWDGVAWVAHEGVVYKGNKEVITYAGITGTANHIVYLADGRRVHLRDAANEGAALAVGERGGSAVRFVDGTSRPDTSYQAATSVGTVLALRAEKVGVSPGHAGGKIASLQSVRSNQHVLCLVTGGSSANAKVTVQQDNDLHKPHGYQPRICSVPQAGDGEQVSVLRKLRSICLGVFTAPRLYWSGDRAHRQHGPLRTGESAVGVPRSECAEPGMQLVDRVSRGTNERTKVLARSEAVLPCEHGKLQSKQGEKFGVHIVPVFDIVNAGPRHRFTANGVIVSNCRVLAWLAGQDDLVAAFERKEDVYKIMSSKIYGVPVAEITKPQRAVGKTIILGAGYGVGHLKLQLFLTQQAGVIVDTDTAKAYIDTYRSTNHMIPQLWKRGEAALRALVYGQEMVIDKQGLLKVVPGKGILLPNGLHIQYPDLRYVVDPDSGKAAWVYTSKGLPVHIYGGKVVENVCQAVARIIIGEQMLRIAKQEHCVLTVHDAVAAVAKEAEADAARAYVEECMNWRPKWAQTLPLACESGMGLSYGDC